MNRQHSLDQKAKVLGKKQYEQIQQKTITNPSKRRKRTHHSEPKHRRR